VRGTDVLLADRRPFHSYALFNSFQGLLGSVLIGSFRSINKAFVILGWKFRVYGKPNWTVGASTWELDREINSFSASGSNLHTSLELLRSHDLLEQAAQRDFSPSPSVLYVGENTFQVADTGRECLHFPDTLKDLF
jgi:hypothetical protein